MERCESTGYGQRGLIHWMNRAENFLVDLGFNVLTLIVRSMFSSSR